ncbi:MAG: DUF502 domain-containing protein [Chlamydiota bacterium]
MKKYFLTGLIILAPFALTLVIVIYLFDLFTTPFLGLVEGLVTTFAETSPHKFLQHKNLILFFSRVIALITLVIVILLLGFLGRKFFFDTLIHWINRIFLKIPFVKNVYRVSKDVTKAFFAQTGKTFKKTVLLPFPHKNTYSLGFVTGNIPEPIKRILKDVDLAVFVPTAPHPFSGFIVLTSKEEAREVDITTEEAFKFLVSCGVVMPGEPVPEKENTSKNSV